MWRPPVTSSAGSVAAFLHENVLHFIEDVAIEDVAGCLEQLSAADCMASGRRWGSESMLPAWVSALS